MCMRIPSYYNFLCWVSILLPSKCLGVDLYSQETLASLRSSSWRVCVGETMQAGIYLGRVFIGGVECQVLGI